MKAGFPPLANPASGTAPVLSIGLSLNWPLAFRRFNHSGGAPGRTRSGGWSFHPSSQWYQVLPGTYCAIPCHVPRGHVVSIDQVNKKGSGDECSVSVFVQKRVPDVDLRAMYPGNARGTWPGLDCLAQILSLIITIKPDYRLFGTLLLHGGYDTTRFQKLWRNIHIFTPGDGVIIQGFAFYRHIEEDIHDYENCTECHRSADEDQAKRIYRSSKNNVTGRRHEHEDENGDHNDEYDDDHDDDHDDD